MHSPFTECHREDPDRSVPDGPEDLHVGVPYQRLQSRDIHPVVQHGQFGMDTERELGNMAIGRVAVEVKEI